MKNYFKFLFFYLLSLTVNICFMVVASELAELSNGRFVLLCYSVSVMSIMAFGYFGMKGLIDDNGQ